MQHRSALLLVGVLGSPAHAQPSLTQPSASTPAKIDDFLATTGNLRLAVACGAAYRLTPATGLTVTVDGAPAAARTGNGFWSTVTDDDGNPSEVWTATDTGYDVAPGHHRVEIGGGAWCAPQTIELDALHDRAVGASGRLEVTDPTFRGPVGSPNGAGIMLGAVSAPTPRGPFSNDFGQSATYTTGHRSKGAMVSASMEHRYAVLAVDFAFTVGDIAGTMSGPSQIDGKTLGPIPFTGSAYNTEMAIRLGARYPMHDFEIAGGSGIAGELWFVSAKPATSTILFSPTGADGSLYVPMWASATFKPGCNWGVQVMAQYDVHPFATDEGGFEAVAGLVFQPAAACSEAIGVHARPL